MGTGNRLASEVSPYLLQHANNPVDWNAWGAEVLERAKREDKPIFLSIGYSTCYWCHVMEQDSFEHEDVAEALRGNFIAVKVDREERPDVDQIYMDAVVAISGHGGWPLSVFLMPDGRPFWGGTFFYRAQFVQILNNITNAWRNRREDVIRSAEALTENISDKNIVRLNIPNSAELLFDNEVIRVAVKSLEARYDSEFGGFGAAPKFPQPTALGLLLRAGDILTNTTAHEMLRKTLDCMFRGGMYDHVGGGFARYSVDEQWIVPHFEKMLYDQAQIATVYLEAYQRFKNPYYGSIAKEVIDATILELGAPDGGFYSALDAGEVGREGEYYVWRTEDLQDSLQANQFVQAQHLFQLDVSNFEGNNFVLTLNERVQLERRFSPEFRDLQSNLSEIRNRRKKPRRDEKIIVSWNALMISTLAKAAGAFGIARYLDAARHAVAFIERNLLGAGKVERHLCAGKVKGPGCLEDYALLVEALVDLYEATFDVHYIELALKLQEVQDALFWDDELGGYFYSADDSLVLRRKEIFDGAMPSANSVAVGNLAKLILLGSGSNLRERLKSLLNTILSAGNRYPIGIAKALSYSQLLSDSGKVAAISGSGLDAQNIAVELRKSFRPSILVAGAPADSPLVCQNKLPDSENGKALIYLCGQKGCEKPVENLMSLRSSYFNAGA